MIESLNVVQKMICNGWQCLHIQYKTCLKQVSMNRTIIASHHNNGIKLPFIANVCSRKIETCVVVKLLSSREREGQDLIRSKDDDGTKYTVYNMYSIKDK